MTSSPGNPELGLHDPVGILLMASLWTPDSTGSDSSPERKVMVIAHRGASAYAPENTMVALRLAMQQRADALETDVRQTPDGHIVLMHDATVNPYHERPRNRAGIDVGGVHIS